jgi:hypothetical protein
VRWAAEARLRHEEHWRARQARGAMRVLREPDVALKLAEHWALDVVAARAQQTLRAAQVPGELLRSLDPPLANWANGLSPSAWAAN